MSTTASRKAKGRSLQNHVRDWLRYKYGELVHPDNIESRPMGSSGTDIILSPLAKEKIPWDIECKCQESISIWSAWEQAVANTQSGRKPLLVIKRNRSEVLAVMRLDDVL